ncbi:MAG: F0F1 ATP synthase subunit epsilon [Candidatus Saccharicenans sp.]|mgnify:FL=1|nr:F0F1 ATP synthase subunit epsilon [Candidatus Saccharicenans sp.]HOJ26976.1 F0F1 ATP synthase subunit epsilon [Candidatus Saccharicenans sp.]HOM95078.1 F0F1 ATP synthase subunit epsilon [Candidatus Saccharicenans sp.]HPP24836.1 F0F1 ATP synthase subunit epsilon [Candidatus Saccharicenans sp.]
MSSESSDFFELKVISPTRLLTEGRVTELQVPGLDGYLGIWPGHRPLNACLGPGEIIFKTIDNREERVTIKGGVIKVEPAKILIMADLEEK